MSSPLKSPIRDFLATVLVFKPHIFSRDNLVAFDPYQSEKVRNTRIVNLTVTTIWVRFTWRVLLVCVRFLPPWWVSCNVVVTFCFEVFTPPHIVYRCSVFVFFCNTDKKNKCDSYKKNVGHVLCHIFQLWRFRLVCLWQLIILFPPAK